MHSGVDVVVLAGMCAFDVSLPVQECVDAGAPSGVAALGSHTLVGVRDVRDLMLRGERRCGDLAVSSDPADERVARARTTR